MDLIEKAKAFNKRITQMTAYNSVEVVRKAVNNELTVEQMYEYDGLFPAWTMGTFAVDDIRNHNGALYRCIQEHDSTGNPQWTPDITPSLWVVIQLAPEGDAILNWIAGEVVNIGDLRTYNGKTYECIQGHTTQSTYIPDVTPALWKVVNIEPETPVTYPEWVQPTSQNPYNIGDTVTYNGKVYKSKINNNVWSPSAYQAGWELIA